MDKYILGISAFYHDAAAAIIKNTEIIAAAQEERFSRKKHDPRFPVNAINYCLAEAFIEPEDIDMIVFYDHPILTFDRLLKNHITVGEAGKEVFKKAFTTSLGIKWWVEDYVKKSLGSLGKEGRLSFCGHHMSHAASAFYPSPFKEAAILTIDGVGEWQTTTLCHGVGENIKVLAEINYPHSLGLLYSAFTSYCGFKVNSGEYKLMGLAPYGKPVYTQLIYENLVSVKEDGSFRLNLKYFGFTSTGKTTNDKFHQLFNGEPRRPESMISQKEMDIAASIQRVTEEIMLRLAKYCRDLTNSDNLCLAGGVALNCVANGKIIQSNTFKNVWIQPAAGDAGGALGAALVCAYHQYNQKRVYSYFDSQKGSYLGPSFSENEIAAFLNRSSYSYKKYSSSDERNEVLARELCRGKIVGFFSGRMEFGPRSLGARSIIGDARNNEMQSKMNLKIKFRESFRPFAPAVLYEDAEKYFDLNVASPYMLLVAPVRKEKRLKVEGKNTDDMVELINQVRSEIPAVTHVDYSARIQTIHKETNEEFYNLVNEFKKQTGSSVLVNTSFNVRGEPVVCTPKDAYLCFMRTNIDILVLENFVLFKGDQPPLIGDENWEERYELD
jgi:carbamoyltransferase